MKPSSLVTMMALVSALGAGLPARAASCLSLELNAPVPMCAGQTSMVSATVTNSCSNRMSATAQLAIDGQTLPFEIAFAVPANSSRTRGIGVPVPASATPTSHTLTITLTDSAGDESSATIDLSISNCLGTTPVTKSVDGRLQLLH